MVQDATRTRNQSAGAARWSDTRSRGRIRAAAPLGSASAPLGEDQDWQFGLLLSSLLPSFLPSWLVCSFFFFSTASGSRCESPDDFQPTTPMFAPPNVHNPKKTNLSTQSVFVFWVEIFFLREQIFVFLAGWNLDDPTLSSHGLLVCEIHCPPGECLQAGCKVRIIERLSAKQKGGMMQHLRSLGRKAARTPPCFHFQNLWLFRSREKQQNICTI